MKTTLTILILLIIGPSSAFCQHEKQFVADIPMSSMSWTGYAQAGNYAPTGKIKLKKGHITINNGEITSGSLTIDMSSISHENSDLQEHLKKPDFFDSNKFPQAYFELKSIGEKAGTGKLTIKGISKLITFPYALEIRGNRVTVKVSMEIDRTQFGIKYNSNAYFQDLGNYAIKDKFLLIGNIEFVSK